MTEDEKLALTRTLCGQEPRDVPDEVLSSYLSVARDVVLARRNPFSDDPTGEDWEPRFDRLQCEIANDMVSRRGAEGEVTHTENGISRQWVTGYVAPALLARIVPRARAL